MSIHIRLSDQENEILRNIIYLSPYGQSDLLRKCFFEDYHNETINIYTRDLEDFIFKAYATKNDLIIAEAERIYKNIEQARTKIARYVVRYLLQCQEEILERDGTKTTEIIFVISDEEKTIIKKLAKEFNVSVSRLIKQKVFSSCVGKNIVVKSFLISASADVNNLEMLKRISVPVSVTEMKKEAKKIVDGIYIHENDNTLK